MPNWVTNYVDIAADNIEEIIDYIKGEDRVFDFDKIIPMPECLNADSAPYDFTIAANVKEYVKRNNIQISDKTKAALKTAESRYESREKDDDQTAKFLKAMEETGYWSWYNWRIDHWGTKWNAVDAEISHAKDSISYQFDTAWSMPYCIFKALSKKFSCARINVISVYEEGKVIKCRFENGEITSYNVESIYQYDDSDEESDE
jgi:hypothetical protein